MSEHLIALVLGVVEGVTEYLPVSSTGHLILSGEALKFNGDKAKSFDVIIQVGAILAVVLLYRRRFEGLFKNALDISRIKEPGLAGAAGLAKLAAVTFPALVVGFLFKDLIKEHLFYPLPVAAALAAGAIVILIVESGDGRTGRDGTGSSIDTLTLRQSVLIGCVQCAALWPGMSRSAAAIIGGMLAGLNRRSAAEFSFLAAVPVLTAASLAESLKAMKTFSSQDLELLAVGLVVSFFTALLTVKWFIGFVSRVSLRPFAWYRLALAAVVMALLYTGWGGGADAGRVSVQDTSKLAADEKTGETQRSDNGMK